jgi:hypothetical protein
MKKAIQVLNELKREGVFEEYAIGGARGAFFYIETSFTEDLDIFIIFPKSEEGRLDPLTPIYNSLRKRGYIEKGEFMIIEGYLVQFLPASGDLLEESLQEAYTKKYEGISTRVIRPEHLIAIALKTGRAKDRIRVRQLNEQAPMVNEYLYSVLDRYELGEEFEEWRK